MGGVGVVGLIGSPGEEFEGKFGGSGFVGGGHGGVDEAEDDMDEGGGEILPEIVEGGLGVDAETVLLEDGEDLVVIGEEGSTVTGGEVGIVFVFIRGGWGRWLEEERRRRRGGIRMDRGEMRRRSMGLVLVGFWGILVRWI